MIITNRFGAHPMWVKAAEAQRAAYDKVGWRSVTSLNTPVRSVLLTERHDPEIEIDVIDCMPQLIGSAVHSTIENAIKGDPQYIVEQRFTATLDEHPELLISFKPDLLTMVGNGIVEIHDIKVVQAWAIILGSKIEWARQLNCYAYLLHKHGYQTNSATIQAYVKDWSLREKQETHGYPERAVITQTIDLWSPTITHDYLLAAVNLFLAAEQLPDDQLPKCSPEERWARPAHWAIFDIEKKRAVKVCDTEEVAKYHKNTMIEDVKERIAGAKGKEKEKAETRLEKIQQCSIMHRPGVSVRCDRYCLARPWCNQYKEEILVPF